MRTPKHPFRPSRVALVEDHRLQRQRTEDLFRTRGDFELVHSSESPSDFVRWLRRVPVDRRPHLLILDLVIDHGRDADPELIAAVMRSGIAVMVLSAMTSPSLVRAMLTVGVSAIVGKRDSEDDIIAAASAALRGEPWISPDLAAVMAADNERPHLSIQEERTLTLYASGLSLPDVAKAMGVQPDTAKQYLKRVKRKYASLGRPASTKFELNRLAQEDGYLD